MNPQTGSGQYHPRKRMGQGSEIIVCGSHRIHLLTQMVLTSLRNLWMFSVWEMINLV